MEFEEFRKSLQEPSPAYFLKTDQAYLKRRVFEEARSQVAETARSFDWSVFDLENDPEIEVVNEARTLPWMSPRRWIFVHSAHEAKAELLEYLKKPVARAVLVLETQKAPPRGLKLPVIEMPQKLDAVAWARRQASEKGVKLGSEAAETLVELLGDDLQRLDSELEKLALLNYDAGEIEKDSVLSLERQSQRYNVFSLVGAMAARRTQEALEILNWLLEGGSAVPQIAATLAWNFRRLLVARELLEQRRPFQTLVRQLKIYSYKAREKEVRAAPPERYAELLIRLRDLDRLFKTTSGDEKSMLERLIVDTCSNKSI